MTIAKANKLGRCFPKSGLKVAEKYQHLLLVKSRSVTDRFWLQDDRSDQTSNCIFFGPQNLH